MNNLSWLCVCIYISYEVDEILNSLFYIILCPIFSTKCYVMRLYSVHPLAHHFQLFPVQRYEMMVHQQEKKKWNNNDRISDEKREMLFNLNFNKTFILSLKFRMPLSLLSFHLWLRKNSTAIYLLLLSNLAKMWKYKTIDKNFEV